MTPYSALLKEELEAGGLNRFRRRADRRGSAGRMVARLLTIARGERGSHERPLIRPRRLLSSRKLQAFRNAGPLINVLANRADPAVNVATRPVGCTFGWSAIETSALRTVEIHLLMKDLPLIGVPMPRQSEQKRRSSNETPDRAERASLQVRKFRPLRGMLGNHLPHSGLSLCRLDQPPRRRRLLRAVSYRCFTTRSPIAALATARGCCSRRHRSRMVWEPSRASRLLSRHWTARLPVRPLSAVASSARAMERRHHMIRPRARVRTTNTRGKPTIHNLMEIDHAVRPQRESRIFRMH